MNLTIAKEKLLHGLQAVQNVVSTRTTLPILSNVLMKAEGNKLEFTATDLDVTDQLRRRGQSQEERGHHHPGEAVLWQSCANWPAPKLNWKWMRNTPAASAPGPRFTRSTAWAPTNFRPSRSSRRTKKSSLPQEKIKSMLRKTSFAISTDESRYVLNGIFIILKEHKMTMVATDGRRLALVDEEVDIPETSQGEFIIPTKAVNEITRLLGDKGDVEMKFSENQVALHPELMKKAMPRW